MPMSCNIDRRGRVARLIWGVTLIILAAAMAAAILMGWLLSAWWWLGVAALALFGVFALYEARKGWCAVRAMGFKTPM